MVEDTEIADSQNEFMKKTSVLIMGAIPMDTHTILKRIADGVPLQLPLNNRILN